MCLGAAWLTATGRARQSPRPRLPVRRRLASAGRAPTGARQNRPSAAAALRARTEPRRKRLAVLATQLPVPSDLKQLQRHPRRLSRRLEQAHAGTRKHRITHAARLG